MDMHTPVGARPIHLTGEPVGVQLVDTWYACHPQQDPDYRIACVAVHVDLGHHLADRPRLMSVDRYWGPPEPLDHEAAMRWAQIQAVSKDIFDVRPSLVAEVEQLADDLVVLTFWAVAEQPAPGVRHAVQVRGEWVWP